MKDVSEQKKKSAPEAKGATAVRKFHTHSIPLDMEDIARDWEKPVVDAGIAAKASVIVRVGMLDLGAGTGSFRVREMMHRIAYPLGVHVRADVNLTDIEATCTDGRNRITEVVDLPKMVDHEQEKTNEELQKLIDTLMEQLERASEAFDKCVPSVTVELTFSEAKQALEDAMKTCVFLIYKIKN